MASDPQKLKISKQIDRPDILMSIARLPESNQLFVGSSDGKIYHLDVMAEKPAPRELVGHGHPIQRRTFVFDVFVRKNL